MWGGRGRRDSQRGLGGRKEGAGDARRKVGREVGDPAGGEREVRESRRFGLLSWAAGLGHRERKKKRRRERGFGLGWKKKRRFWAGLKEGNERERWDGPKEIGKREKRF